MFLVVLIYIRIGQIFYPNSIVYLKWMLVYAYFFVSKLIEHFDCWVYGFLFFQDLFFYTFLQNYTPKTHGLVFAMGSIIIPPKV